MSHKDGQMEPAGVTLRTTDQKSINTDCQLFYVMPKAWNLPALQVLLSQEHEKYKALHHPSSVYSFMCLSNTSMFPVATALSRKVQHNLKLVILI